MALPDWVSGSSTKSSGNLAFKGATIAISSGLVRFAGSLFVAIVLGRLLSPDDFGLVAMITPIIAIISVFADGGVSYYTLQVKKVDENDLNLTFWLGALIALVLFLLLFLSAPYISLFYDEERLRLTTSVLASDFLISIYVSQHNALVKKCYRQDLYAISEIFATLTSLIFSVALALNGAGYWALVAIPLTRHASHALMIWYLTKWVPGVPTFSMEKSKEILSFGWYMVIGLVVVSIGRNLDKVIVGWKLGTEEAGYYAMAYNIMMLPFLQILSPVAGALVPHLSEVKEDIQEFNSSLQNIALGLGITVAPIMIWASIVSEPLLITFLGDKWQPSGEIFSMLALASIVLCFSSPLYWTFISNGMPEKQAFWTSVSLIPMIGSFLLGVNWGGVGVAIGHLLTVTVLFLILPAYVNKYLDIDIKGYMTVVFKSVLASGLSGVLVFLAKRQMEIGEFGTISILIFTFLILVLSLPMFLYCFFGREKVKNILALVRKSH